MAEQPRPSGEHDPSSGDRGRAHTVPSLPASRAADVQFCVRVTKGAECGVACLIGQKPLTIGTSAGNGLCLSDRRVSRFHCEVFTRGEQCIVRDLGSTNGTCVDGVTVVEAALSPGAVIGIGHTELVLELHDDVSAMETDEPVQFGEMVGRSKASLQMFAALRRVAKSSLTCLLLGETGTGKELAARALHEHSERASKPFLVVDCAAVGPQFIEDKLFGHDKGAFTGATAARPGVFEQAHGGTVFLDEIGELPIDLQPKLLGVLERRQATRIGSHMPIKLDVRVVAATHRDLGAMARRSLFRQDLLYRLSEFTLRLPALRERCEDIGWIAQAVLRREGFGSRRLTPDAIAHLEAMSWHGNIRELRNVLRRAALLAASATIDRALLQQLDAVTSEFHVPPEDLLPVSGEEPGFGGATTPSMGVRSLAPAPSRSLAPIPSGLIRPLGPVAPPAASPSSEDAAFALPLEQATEAFRRAYVQELRRRFGNDLNRAAAHAGIHPKSVSRLFRMYGTY
jgi:DNA-binding NtrC family response regulator